MHQLEDNSLTRGRIMAFDLEAVDQLPARTSAFTAISRPELRDQLGAAL